MLLQEGKKKGVEAREVSVVVNIRGSEWGISLFMEWSGILITNYDKSSSYVIV